MALHSARILLTGAGRAGSTMGGMRSVAGWLCAAQASAHAQDGAYAIFHRYYLDPYIR